MFQRVVVGIRTEEAGRDAIALAKRLVAAHGDLTLLHVYVAASKPAPDSGAAGDALKRRDALERLTALATEFSVAAGVSWVQAPSVRRGLHESAVSRHADLLVVRATHYDDVARDLAGDDTRVVLEDAPCAVAVAPVGYSLSGGELTKIGVAYDGSPDSERALSLARTLADERHATLSAFEAVGASPRRDPWNVGAEFAQPVSQARQRLAALGGLDAEAGFGEAVEELTRYASSVDLLVIGSHSYGPIGRLVQRSTAQRLADQAPSPLLVLARTT